MTSNSGQQVWATYAWREGSSVQHRATGNRAGGELGLRRSTTGSAGARRVTTDEHHRDVDCSQWPAQQVASCNGRQHAQLGGSHDLDHPRRILPDFLPSEAAPAGLPLPVTQVALARWDQPDRR